MRVAKSTDFRCVFGLLLCPSSLVWQLAEWVGLPQLMALGYGFIKWIECHYPGFEPFLPTAWNCACWFHRSELEQKCIPGVACRISNCLTHKGLDHPFLLHHPLPSSFLLSIQASAHGPTEQFLEQWWLCVDLVCFECSCLCPKVCT